MAYRAAEEDAIELCGDARDDATLGLLVAAARTRYTDFASGGAARHVEMLHRVPTTPWCLLSLSGPRWANPRLVVIKDGATSLAASCLSVLAVIAVLGNAEPPPDSLDDSSVVKRRARVL